MNIGIYTSLFFLSTVKFMFAPMSGPALGLTFFETYLSCVGGAIFSAAIFYFSANYFMRRAREKYLRKVQRSIENGTPLKQKRNFTRVNKLVVRIKRSMGLIGISFWAPLFLSIPGGSIVTAKFYGKKSITFPLIVAGIFFNGAVITGITYLF